MAMLPRVMPFRFGLASLRFSDGTSIDLPDKGVLVLVGPNNAGKSVALRDIVTRITRPAELQPSRVVTDVALRRDGTTEELESWLTEHAFRRVQPGGEVYFK